MLNIAQFNKINLFCLLFTVATLVLYALVPEIRKSNYIFVLAIIGTVPLLLSLKDSIIHREFSIDMLAGIALTASYIAVEIPSVLLINLMIISAKILSEYTEKKTANALEKLIKLRPTHAKLKVNGKINIVPVSQIKTGDIIMVIVGDRVPVDGVIIHGEAAINQSSLTGESIPIDKSLGDKVFTSTIVESGEIEVRAEKVGSETSFEKIVRLVENASNNRSRIDTFGQRFTKIYIVTVLISSVVLFALTYNTNIVLSLLLVVCADDLAIAIPLAYIAGIGQAAQKGIIIKGASYLDEVRNIRHLVLDKTGTITKGMPNVSQFELVSKKYSLQEAMEYAGSASKLSKHPISQALYKYVSSSVKPFEPDDYEIINGNGVYATHKSKNIFLGSEKFILSRKIKLDKEKITKIKLLREKGLNVTLLAINVELVAIICIEDEVKYNVRNTVEDLYSNGITEITVLTGDNNYVAERITKLAGIKEFHSDLMPEQKLDYINEYKKKSKVAMVGDGVNDTPSLVAADLGIAMGAIGSDVAIESADIVLMDDNFGKIAVLQKLSKVVFKVARTNIAIWGVVNALGIALVFTGHLNPSAAAAYNFATDFIPIINSMRIFRHK